MPEVRDVDPQEVTDRRAKLLRLVRFRGVFHHVQHEPRPQASERRGQQGVALGVLARDPCEDPRHRGALEAAVAVLAQLFEDGERARALVQRGVHRAEDHVLQEQVRVQEGREGRCRHDDAPGGQEKEVQRVRTGARAEVQHEKIARQRFQAAHQPFLLGRLEVRRPRHLGITGDERETVVLGGKNDLLEGRPRDGQERADSPAHAADAQHGVRVGGAEVQVDQHDPPSRLGQRDGQVRGQEGFADAALAASNGKNRHCCASPPLVEILHLRFVVLGQCRPRAGRDSPAPPAPSASRSGWRGTRGPARTPPGARRRR